MSGGHGAVQRRLLDILTQQDRLIDTIELTALVFNVQPNDAGQHLVNKSQLASVRRSLGKLAREGEAIDCGRNWRSERRLWASPSAAKAYYDSVKNIWGTACRTASSRPQSSGNTAVVMRRRRDRPRARYVPESVEPIVRPAPEFATGPARGAMTWLSARAINGGSCRLPG